MVTTLSQQLERNFGAQTLALACHDGKDQLMGSLKREGGLRKGGAPGKAMFMKLNRQARSLTQGPAIDVVS